MIACGGKTVKRFGALVVVSFALKGIPPVAVIPVPRLRDGNDEHFERVPNRSDTSTRVLGVGSQPNHIFEIRRLRAFLTYSGIRSLATSAARFSLS
jgi:hypothetical protein